MFKKYFLIIAAVITFDLFYFPAAGRANEIAGKIVNKVNKMNQAMLAGSKQSQSAGFIDIDRDGVDDKVIGAPYSDFHSRTGSVLVYRGNIRGGFSSQPLMLFSNDDNFGFSFKNIGDTDDDGGEEFAVGAINGNGVYESLCGSISVYNGCRNIITRLSGEGPMDKFGIFISAGDLNGDGKKDLITGAPFNTKDPALYQAGAVYVYFAPEFTSKIALYASSTNKGLGWSAEAGDINGDNIDDLCVSAGGKVLCYYGGEAFNPSVDFPDVIIKSAGAGFGKAIAIPGDLNGDGLNEIVIGAPNAVVSGNKDTGSIYIIKGGTGNRTINVDLLTSDLIVKINGESLFNRFGYAIARAGDIDGDQKPDFAVSAPLADAGSLALSGKVYFFYGKDINSSSTLANSTVINGFEKNQGFGTSLASDGKGRLLIGAPRDNKDTGRAYLIDIVSGSILN